MSEEQLDKMATRFADLVWMKIQARPSNGLIDAAGAAELLGCSRPTIERWTKSGVIPSHKIGGLRRYRPSELLDRKGGAT